MLPGDDGLPVGGLLTPGFRFVMTLGLRIVIARIWIRDLYRVCCYRYRNGHRPDYDVCAQHLRFIVVLLLQSW